MSEVASLREGTASAGSIERNGALVQRVARAPLREVPAPEGRAAAVLPSPGACLRLPRTCPSPEGGALTKGTPVMGHAEEDRYVANALSGLSWGVIDGRLKLVGPKPAA